MRAGEAEYLEVHQAHAEVRHEQPGGEARGLGRRLELCTACPAGKYAASDGARCAALGSVWAFGWNDCGQLGLGDTLNKARPTLLDSSGVRTETVSCGDRFSFLISDANEIMIAGKLPFNV